MKSTSKKTWFSIVLLFAFAHSVQAQTTYTWMGGVDTSWTTAGNWTSGNVPALLQSSNPNDQIVFSGTTMPASNIPAGLGYSNDISRNHIPMVFNSGGTFNLNMGVQTLQSFMSWGDQTKLTVGDGSSGGTENVTVNITGIDRMSRHPDGITSFVVKSDGVLDVNQAVAYSVVRNFTMEVDGGTFNAGSWWDRGGATLLEIKNGGEVTIDGHMNQSSSTSDILFTDGSLTVGRMSYNDPTDQALVVGSTSTLNLGDGGNHIFTDGLTLATGGTLGTGNNSATTATFGDGGTITLSDGAVIDYSINGNLNGGTGDLFDFAGTSQLVLDAAHTYELVVDVVAGDVKQTAGPFEIFSGNWVVNGGPLSSSMFNITAGDGTRLSSQGFVELGVDAQSGSIVLSGFEAFSIPEPSTTLLLGMGAVVIALRRRMQRA